MNGELNSEALPFEASDRFRKLASEQSGFALDEELGRRPQSRRHSVAPRAPAVMSKRPGTLPVSLPIKPKEPAMGRPPFPPYPRRRPWGVVGAPFAAVPEQYPVESEPSPSEPTPPRSQYMRWMQSALNDVLGSQPVHGSADSATRSAIRSFRQREGLPTALSVPTPNGHYLQRELESARKRARRGHLSRRHPRENSTSNGKTLRQSSTMRERALARRSHSHLENCDE